MRPPRIRRGVSLVEVLFATGLALVCAMIFAAAMPVANASRAKASANDVATSLAVRHLEQIKARGYGQIDNVALAQGPDALIDSSTPTVGVDHYPFTLPEFTLPEDDPSALKDVRGLVQIRQAGIGMKRVIVRIRYREGSIRREVRVGTLVAYLRGE